MGVSFFEDVHIQKQNLLLWFIEKLQFFCILKLISGKPH